MPNIIARRNYRRSWGPVAVRGAAYAVRSAYNNFKSRSSNSTNQGRGLQSTPAPITGFEDARTTYTRKRMPRRKRRVWRRFVKKARAVDLGLSAPNFYVAVRNASISSAANKQTVTDIHTVLGLNGSFSTSDVRDIATRVASLTTGTADQQKFAITGWLAETQVVNTSAGVAYLDLYYWRCYKAVPDTVSGTAGSAVTLFSLGLADLAGAFPIGGSTLDALDYGVTPYQSPKFSGYLKVYKKTRVKLSGGGGVTQIETRSGRNYFRDYSVDEELSMDKRCTEGILMIAYGTPSATNGTADPVTLRFATNINYTYKVLQRNIITGGTNVL